MKRLALIDYTSLQGKKEKLAKLKDMEKGKKKIPNSTTKPSLGPEELKLLKYEYQGRKKTTGNATN